MMKIFLRFVILSALIWILANYIDGISVSPFWMSFVVSLVFMILDAVLKPILELLALPITFLTLGLFSLVISVGLFGLMAYILQGFDITTVVALVKGALIMAFANFALKKFL